MEFLGNYTNEIQSFGIIATLFLAFWQMRIQSKQVEAATDLALTSKFDEINKIWVDNPGLFKLLKTEFDENNLDARLSQLETTMFIVFNTLELAYKHRTHYGMKKDAWSEWAGIIDLYLHEPYVKKWWCVRAAHEYGLNFRVYVNQRKRDLEKAEPKNWIGKFIDALKSLVFKAQLKLRAIIK